MDSSSDSKSPPKTSTALRRLPGHLRWEEGIYEYALAIILSFYDSYEPFVQDCLRSNQVLMVLSGDRLAPAIPTEEEREAVQALARRWNLDRIPAMREFSYRRVFQAVHQTGRSFGKIVGRPFSPFSMGSARWEPENPRVTYGGRSWEWSLGSHESLGRFRERIATDLKCHARHLPKEILVQLRAAPDEAVRLGWQLSDEKHKFIKHAYWLFLRLCPLPDRPLSPTQIALLWDAEYKSAAPTDVRMLRRTTDELAKKMLIELPRIKLGRPSLFDSRVVDPNKVPPFTG